MTDTEQDRMFFALAHTARRRMIDIIKKMPGCSVNDVAKYFSFSRIAVLKHLGVLEEARLILSRKNGRVREIHFNAAPLQLVVDRWTNEYASFWAARAMDLKYTLENTSTPSP